MSGAIPPFPNTLSWRGAQLKPKDNVTFLHLLRLGEELRFKILAVYLIVRA
jgi:hypothetical protein